MGFTKFGWRPVLPTTDRAAKTNLDSLAKWIDNLGYIKPQVYHHYIDNGTSTAYAVYGSNSSLLAQGTQFDLRMYVEIMGFNGFSGVGNLLNIQIRDAAGNNISAIETYGTSALWLDQIAGKYQGHSMFGYVDYPAGTAAGSIGYQLVYKVSASNVYIRSGVKVSFVPSFT